MSPPRGLTIDHDGSADPAAAAAACVDSPTGWKSSDGSTCRDYAEREVTDEIPGIGMGFVDLACPCTFAFHFFILDILENSS